MAVSCDVYFYKTVKQLNLSDLNKTFNDFGFGQKTKIDIPNETVGLVPDSDYMSKRYGKYGWSRGVLLNLAIGQGELLVTPIQVLMGERLAAIWGVPVTESSVSAVVKDILKIGKRFERN